MSVAPPPSGVRRHPRALRVAIRAAALWLALPVAAGAQRAGDVDCDGRVTAGDPRTFAAVLFGNPPPCAAADVNGDRLSSSADFAAIPDFLDAPDAPGPRISWIGLAAASGRPVAELGRLGETPVFFRNAGSGFRIVVEAAIGANGNRPGRTTVQLDDVSRRPDLQFVCNRPLGDGDPAVCDGGIPAVAAPHIGAATDVTLAINDYGCPFESFTAPAFSCTVDSFGNQAFVAAETRTQFCLPVARTFEFPPGDTLCSVQVRDVSGTLGPLASVIVRVDGAANPPTFTPTRPPTPTATRGAAPTPTRPPAATATRTFTRTATPSRPADTPLPSATPTRTGNPTATATPARSATPTTTPVRSATPSPSGVPTAAATATRTATRSPSRTQTPAPTGTPTHSPTSTRASTATPTPTATVTRSATRTRTATLTPSPSRTPTVTPTASRTRTPTASPTATPTGLRGPAVSYLGLARSDDNPVPPAGTTGDGIPIFTRSAGSGFRIVVEGAPGPSGFRVGDQAYLFGAPSFPDLQIFVSRPLGNGSGAVCDRTPPNAGGVPATDPADFNETPDAVAAANDLGCRFLDGSGNPVGRRSADDSCVQTPPDSGTFRFAAATSTIQFCGLVDSLLTFPPGDTLVTVRLRDQFGNVGRDARMIVRIGP